MAPSVSSRSIRTPGARRWATIPGRVRGASTCSPGAAVARRGRGHLPRPPAGPSPDLGTGGQRRPRAAHLGGARPPALAPPAGDGVLPGSGGQPDASNWWGPTGNAPMRLAPSTPPPGRPPAHPAGSPRRSRLSLRGVGPAGHRRPRALRAAGPRGLPVRPLLAHHPAQARELPRRLRRLRYRDCGAASANATSSACWPTPASSATAARSRPRSRNAHAAVAARWSVPLADARLVLRARRAAGGPRATLADLPALDPRVHRSVQGAQAARLSLRRPHHRLRHDAGLRPGQRPPARLLGA